MGSAKPPDKPKESKPRRRVTDEQIIKALQASAGFISVAAKKLGITSRGIRKRLAKSKRLQEARDEIVEHYCDFAESHLLKCVKRGYFPAIKYFLECKGSDRGWRSTQEIDINQGQDLSFNFTVRGPADDAPQEPPASD